ncbi:MAG: sulfite exporter TauE/SafE family protein, partial [Pseudohongiellaceae bacterium]
MDLSLAQFALAIGVILVGSFIQSSIGFGLAIIAAPVLFFIEPLFVPAPITVSALTLSLANARRHRHAISFTGLRAAIAGRIPGTVAGGLLLLLIDQQALALWIGVTVLLAVVVSLTRIRVRPTNGALFSAGFLSGFMGTSSSIGGPPMALVLQHETGDYIRANLAAFFVFSCVLSLAMLALVGRFGMSEILLSLPLMPATLVGYWVAMRTLKYLPLGSVRLGSLLLCALAG